MLSPLPTAPLLVTQLHGSLRGGAREVYRYTHDDGITYQCNGHAGIDLATLDKQGNNVTGIQVHAMKTGLLSISPHDPWRGGYSSGLGLYAVLLLPDGETHLYAHLSTVIPLQGSLVSGGQVFALSGDTGNVPPHLHIAVRPPHPDYGNHFDGSVDFLTHFDHSVLLDLSLV